jgi:hypothetical protein
MEYCIVEDGVIVNMIVAEADFAAEIGALPAYEGAAIGGAYTPPPPEPEPPTTDERLEKLEAELVSAQSAAAITFVTLCETGTIDTVTASEHTELFSPWAYPVDYKTGNIRAHGGKLYRCLQNHTSQETWTPDAAPSLWVGISDPAEEWPAWSQPVGSTDAYAKGAQVSHNGKHWTSDVDANVWEPGVYGWTEAT